MLAWRDASSHEHRQLRPGCNGIESKEHILTRPTANSYWKNLGTWERVVAHTIDLGTILGIIGGGTPGGRERTRRHPRHPTFAAMPAGRLLPQFSVLHISYFVRPGRMPLRAGFQISNLTLRRHPCQCVCLLRLRLRLKTFFQITVFKAHYVVATCPQSCAVQRLTCNCL